MKPNYIIAAVFATIVSGAPAVAQEYTRGTVKEVKADREQVTVIHEELKNLDMPAMTMVFNVADPAMLEDMTEGATIEFVADRVRGKLTITEVK